MSRGRRRGQEEGQGPGRRILGTEARTQPPEPSREDQDVRSLWVMRITRGFTDPGHGQQSGFPALSRELQFPRRRAGAALPTHPASLSIAAHTPLHSASLHTPRFTQHRCTHTATLSIAAHTPLHSASLHTHRFTQHRCTHTASLSIAAHTPDCSHRLADPRTPFPSTQKKKPLFPHFPEGKARI